MGRFKLSREAAADIEAIALYTRERWGKAQANDYVDALMTTCLRIAELPESGSVIDAFDGKVRRYRSGHHILHYRVRDGTVEIVAFRHERSKAP